MIIKNSVFQYVFAPDSFAVVIRGNNDNFCFKKRKRKIKVRAQPPQPSRFVLFFFIIKINYLHHGAFDYYKVNLSTVDKSCVIVIFQPTCIYTFTS